MNLKDRLEHLAIASGDPRQYGKTTLLCKVAKELDAVVIAANFDHVNHLQRTHKVVAKSIDTNMQGLKGPFLFDHFAIETLLFRAANHIDKVEKERDELSKENGKLKDERDQLYAAIDRMREKSGAI